MGVRAGVLLSSPFEAAPLSIGVNPHLRPVQPPDTDGKLGITNGALPHGTDGVTTD